MIYSINDKIRKIISNLKTLSSVIIYFEKIDPNFKEQIIKLAICDFYKINYIMNEYDQINNNFLKNCDLEEIYFESEENYKLLALLINSVIIFEKLDIISKIILFEELEQEEENIKLNNFTILHSFDKMIYNFNYDLISFKEYYIDYLNKNPKMINKRDRASIFMTNKMIDLSQIDINKYKKLILEMIKEYYIWKKFILDHEGGHLLLPADFAYLKIIEDNNLDDILQKIKDDYDFMDTIVGEYLHYTTSKVEINRELVTKYYEKNVENEIQKKLELN